MVEGWFAAVQTKTRPSCSLSRKESSPDARRSSTSHPRARSHLLPARPTLPTRWVRSTGRGNPGCTCWPARGSAKSTREWTGEPRVSSSCSSGTGTNSTPGASPRTPYRICSRVGTMCRIVAADEPISWTASFLLLVFSTITAPVQGRVLIVVIVVVEFVIHPHKIMIYL